MVKEEVDNKRRVIEERATNEMGVFSVELKAACADRLAIGESEADEWHRPGRPSCQSKGQRLLSEIDWVLSEATLSSMLSGNEHVLR